MLYIHLLLIVYDFMNILQTFTKNGQTKTPDTIKPPHHDGLPTLFGLSPIAPQKKYLVSNDTRKKNFNSIFDHLVHTGEVASDSSSSDVTQIRQFSLRYLNHSVVCCFEWTNSPLECENNIWACSVSTRNWGFDHLHYSGFALNTKQHLLC